jgi:alpha-methylacyl-CoA racemase
VTGPLDGLRILDLSRLLPGGYATLLMADLGADVVKLEEPSRGDYIRWMPPAIGEYSAGHVALNRNKRSITLNLRSERGRALLLDLCERFDVLVESFRPGVMERLGVGYEALSERNSKLVYCAITGHGQEGTRAELAGHDINYMGYAGALAITGETGGPPVVPGVQVGDLGGGAMAAVISILAALRHREMTGKGTLCDVAMSDGVLSWLSIHAAASIAGGGARERDAMPLSGSFPCYRVYPAADGYLTVGALEPQFWKALCAALGRDDLVDDGFATGERRVEVIATLETIFKSRTRAGWMEALDGLDACVGPVNELTEVVDDAAFRANGMIWESEIPGAGVVTQIGNPIRIAEAPGDVARRPPPKLGEHTAEVLAEVGFDAGGIEDLRSAGVV